MSKTHKLRREKFLSYLSPWYVSSIPLFYLTSHFPLPTSLSLYSRIFLRFHNLKFSCPWNIPSFQVSSARSRDFSLMRLQRRHRDRRMDVCTHIYPYLIPRYMVSYINTIAHTNAREMRILTSAWLPTFLWKLDGDIPSSDLLCSSDDLRFYRCQSSRQQCNTL